MSSQRSDWRERLHANPSRMEQELAIRLQDDGIRYQTQVEIPVTTADFYFPLVSRPLLVFVDGRVHLGTAQIAKNEELLFKMLCIAYKPVLGWWQMIGISSVERFSLPTQARDMRTMIDQRHSVRFLGPTNHASVRT